MTKSSNIKSIKSGPRWCSAPSFLILWLALWCGLQTVFSQQYGLDSRPAIGPFLNHTLPQISPGISGKWSVAVAFTNLVFTNAVGLSSVPGAKRLCVWEREGRVWTFENTPAATEKKLVLDISKQCQGWDDSGLLGLAFHPGFATNHYLFIYYSWVTPGTVVGSPTSRPQPVKTGAYHDRLSRFTLDTSGVAIPESELVYVDQTGNSVWHNGGGLLFHPSNGFLYWADGDDADTDNTQIINRDLFSGVFRIDVDKRGGRISHPIPRQPTHGATGNYYIPSDNPFVDQPGALEEFFCLGLRNPYRMTLDPSTGRIFIGDVGESTREEIDAIGPDESGLNFQWSSVEGRQGDLKPPYIGKSSGPVLDYSHSDGRAVIGGYVYRGKEFAADLGGKFIFGDNVLRIIWAMDESTTPASKLPLCVMPKGTGPSSGTDYTGLSSFGVDDQGELYLCQMSSVGGRIYKLAHAGAAPPDRPVPPLLSQTRVFSDLASLKTVPGLIPYSVNSPLWSDGAAKQRWIAVPTRTFIGFAPTGEWTFPDGTVFVKNFVLATNETDSTALRRLETRLIVRDTNGFVYGASYRWRPDLSDAELVSTGLTENIVIATPTGTRLQEWFYPGRQDCLRCHTPVSGGVLGVKARQLNRDFTYPSTGRTDNQLRTWSHLGLFDSPLNEADIPRFARLASVTDTNVPLEQRVRSYLDANCANCHQPGGAHAFFDARIETPLEKAGLINGPVENALGTQGSKVVVPADLDRSILIKRIKNSDPTRMPPLARRVVDASAVDAVADWINSLPSAASALPPPWEHRDIGDVGLPGEANYINGRFNLIATGDDIWNRVDAFHMAYRLWDGDGQITARIVSLQQSDPWAKAGVMFRETAAADSKYVALLVTPANGAFLQERPLTGGFSDNKEAPSATVPCWFRLVRSGNTFIGYLSDNGSNWSQTSSVVVPMSKQFHVGLALTSHNRSVLNSALFDSVTILRGDKTLH